MYFHSFQAKQKIQMFHFLRRLIIQTTEATPLVNELSQKFYQNVPDRRKLKVTKFGYARISCFRVTVNNLMVWAKRRPPPSIAYRVKFDK